MLSLNNFKIIIVNVTVKKMKIVHIFQVFLLNCGNLVNFGLRKMAHALKFFKKIGKKISA